MGQLATIKNGVQIDALTTIERLGKQCGCQTLKRCRNALFKLFRVHVLGWQKPGRMHLLGHPG